ncbi:uncharacterized protein FIBRA_02820 [Fibroporia radiculosa]|uniref:Uncharacterized protein n=1 Tax=Fibroporia radiculosa TaxID=599839 RepID=J4G2W4_9APHY|nr:uncharacterized protein FIBRA_02820 [Fibroporia radiculosa]CCM00778.1 predicted protein [Fibroporia radiculosa]
MHFDELCLVTFAPKSIIVAWVVPAGFEALLSTLVIYKFLQNIQDLPGLSTQPILYVFTRDAVWAFLLMLASAIVTALSYTVFPSGLSGSFYFWNISLSSFAGSHVLLNLRQVGANAGDLSSPSLSELDFDRMHFAPQ